MSAVKPSSHENFQPLTDEQVGSLYSAVGCHEGKAIVLGGMSPNYRYRATELHRDLFVGPQGDSPVFIGSNNPYEWTQNSFVPNGLVKEEHNDCREYLITDFGYEEGRSLAGWQLDLSLDMPDSISLRGVLGMSKTRPEKTTRPAIDRLNIFRMLDHNASLSAVELSDKLGINKRTMTNNIDWLVKQGIVEYDAVQSRQLPSEIGYELSRHFDLSANGGSMREAIYGTITEMQKDGRTVFSASDLLTNTENIYSTKNFNIDSHRKHAYQILNELITEGHLAKTSYPEIKSEISLNPFMRTIVRQILDVSDGVRQNHPDFTREGHLIMNEILADDEMVKELVAKAFKNSPEANGKSLALRSSNIKKYLEQQPGADLSKIAEDLSEQGMTKSSIRETLHIMRKEGQLTSVKNKNINNWYLV